MCRGLAFCNDQVMPRSSKWRCGCFQKQGAPTWAPSFYYDPCYQDSYCFLGTPHVRHFLEVLLLSRPKLRHFLEVRERSSPHLRHSPRVCLLKRPPPHGGDVKIQNMSNVLTASRSSRATHEKALDLGS